MPSYKDLYFKLLRAQSKAVELLTTTAQEAEEVVISEEEVAIPLWSKINRRQPSNKNSGINEMPLFLASCCRIIVIGANYIGCRRKKRGQLRSRSNCKGVTSSSYCLEGEQRNINNSTV